MRKSYGILLFFLVILPLKLRAQNTTDSFAESFSSFLQSVNTQEPKDCNSPPSALQRPQCPVRVPDLCRLANAECQRVTGSSTCMETNERKIQQRKAGGLQNAKANLRNKMIRLRSDPALQQRCCAGNQKCIDKFTKVNVVVVADNDTNLAGAQAHYDPNVDLIRISERRLAQSLSFEDLDYLLLHEMGHACQHGIASGRGNLDTNTVGMSALGSEVESCIRSNMREFSRRGTVEISWSWQSEIFADAIFSFKRNHLRHWAVMCSRLGNASTTTHPDSNIYLQCLFRDPAVQRLFCTGNSSY